jgi:hypothetical protein
VLSLLLVQAATTAPAEDSGGQGPLVVVILAVITLGGTVITAMGPTFLEVAKGRGSRRPAGAAPAAPEVPGGAAPPPNPAPPLSPEPTPTTAQMVQSAQSGLGMVEAAVLDYREQRNAAMTKYQEALTDLDEARDIIREQAVYIAQLEARANLRQPNYGGRHGSPPDTRPWGS